MVIKSSDLEVKNMVFSKLEDHSYITSQKISLISYNGEGRKLLCQTPEFLTETYGIPREGPFYTTARSRAFYKLPFCHDRHQYPEQVDYTLIEGLYNKFREIDKHCDTDEFRLQMFGDKQAAKYTYQPLIRDGETIEDEAATATGYYRPPYTKVKLDLMRDTDEPCFRLWEKTQDGRKEIALKSFNDILKHMRFMTKHRIIIHFSKLYAMKTASGNEKKKYGIVLKAFAVECENKALQQIETEEDIFMD